MPPLPADSIHARACKLKCEKILTRPVIGFPVMNIPTIPHAHRHSKRPPINVDGLSNLVGVEL